MTSHIGFVLVLTAAFSLAAAFQTPPPPDANRRLFALGDFRLESGAVLPNAKIGYVTFGTLNARRDNAILIPSWYGSDYHGYDFLIGPGRALDPATYFLVATEMFANGFSSSPSNTPPPYDGPAFPPIAIRDNVEAARRLLTAELNVPHLRAVVGFSMGAEQAFQWAVSHPDFVTDIVAYCGTAKTYPHGVVRLESAIAALTADAAFRDGRYTSPPVKGLAAWSQHWAAWVWSQEWWRRELFKPQWATPAEVIAARVARDAVRDPNNMIAQARTWQRHDVGDTPGFGGDHERALRSIAARVLYMPSETDLYFPPGDAQYESRFLAHVTWSPIPSLWGHSAGSGGNPADNAFLNDRIREFLERQERQP
jgi:homoserine O-acetyltransferase/O-succinyltransferase